MSQPNDWEDVPLDSNDDWQDVEVSSPISESTSFGKGITQGMAVSFADEGGGAIGKLLEYLPGSSTRQDDELRAQGFKLPESPSYTSLRDENRAEYQAAEEANPGYYFTGNLIGGALSPANAIPGMAVSKSTAALPFLSKESLKAAAKVGAAQGAAAGLGMSNADLTKGELGQAALDTTIGATVGTVGAPVIQGTLGGVVAGGRYAGKKIGEAGKKIGEQLEKVIPSVVTSYKAGKVNPNLSPEEFFENTLKNYTKMGEKASQYYGEVRSGFEQNARMQEEDILRNKAIQIKLDSDQLLAEGRINEANKMVKDFEDDILKLSKQNEKLNKEADTALQQQQKQLLKEAEEQAKLENDLAVKAKSEEIKQSKSSLKNAEEKFKISQQATFNNASQETQNVLVQSADQLDLALVSHKDVLQKGYQDISVRLDTQGIKFSSKDMLKNALDDVNGDKSITEQAKLELSNELKKIIPVDENLNLSQLKEIVQKLNGEASAASRAGNNRLARIINNTAKQSKELGYDKISNPETLNTLKSLDNDYSNIFKIENYLNSTNGQDKVSTLGALKQVLPNSQGIETGEAQILKRELGNIGNSNMTASGQNFNNKLNQSLGQVSNANEQKLAAKYNKQMLQDNSEVQRIELLLQDLENQRNGLKPKEASIPELENVGPQRQDLNNQKINEAQTQINDLKQQVFNDTDSSVNAQLAKSEKQVEIDKLQSILDNYKAKNLNRDKASPIDEILNIRAGDTEPREQVLLKQISNSTKENVDSSQVKSRKVINDLVDKKVLDTTELEQFKKDDEVSGYIKRKVDEGSASDRGIIMRAIPRTAYNTGRKFGNVYTKTPQEVTSVINQANPTYGKMLNDALIRGDSSYKSLLYILQQQDVNFRKLLKETNLIETDESK